MNGNFKGHGYGYGSDYGEAKIVKYSAHDHHFDHHHDDHKFGHSLYDHTIGHSLYDHDHHGLHHHDDHLSHGYSDGVYFQNSKFSRQSSMLFLAIFWRF